MPALLGVGLLLYGLLFDRGVRLMQSGLRPAEGGFALIRALIGAAPLLGLLGTVSGLIESFEAMVDEAKIREIGVGIGHALRTTQYGMAIAAPALLLERLLDRLERRRRADP